jgi:glycosyltransferase involved in cell wall biosynthesis
MRPLTIPSDIKKYRTPDININQLISETREGYKRLVKDSNPQVTVSIPAYNEEKTIVQTLHSICQNITSYSVEIIVTNNNSNDKTAELVEACGITCFFESKQGISFARNCGLSHAQGRYLVNADADTIYPKNWIEELIKPLEKNEQVVLTYGRFSLLPLKNTPRLTYFLYEYIADASRKFNKYFKDEAVNVYGFNSAFRKDYAFEVNGFEHPPGAIEDGYLALKLRNKGFGELRYVKKALVWTTDRRIHIDGGLWKGTIKRVKRVVGIR